MSILHNQSLTIADATGTLTVGAFPLTSTVAATDIVKPSAWNSAHNLVWNLAGNTVGQSSLSGTDIVLAGGNGITLSGIQGANVATISFSAGGGAAGISFSAGTTSSNLGSLVFSNSNGVSFGLNGSTITGSVATSLSNVNISAGTTSNNLSNLVFSNSNGVSFGIAGSTVTASVAAAGAGGTVSYFANYSNLQDVATIAVSNSSSFIAPFLLPLPLSASYFRFVVAQGFGTNSTTGTSANTSLANSMVSTFALGLYSQGTGASSLSLSLVASTSVGSTVGWSVTANANGSEFTVSLSASYPVNGGLSSFSSSYASSLGTYRYLSSAGTNFDVGTRSFMALDVPFATSLSAGAYWMMVGNSSSSAGNGPAQSNPASFYMLTGISNPLQIPGVATNVSQQQRLGLGVFSTNTSAFQANIALANISIISSAAGQALFQAIRQA